MRRSVWGGIGMHIILLLLSAALFPVASLAASPSKYLVVTYEVSNNKVNEFEFSIMEFTQANEAFFIMGAPPGDGGHILNAEAADGAVIAEVPAYPRYYNFLSFSANMKSLTLLRDGIPIHTQSLSFCDFDSTCESCSHSSKELCSLSENSLTCSDCPTGGNDGYCDTYNDGICDLDCNGRDADCAGCLTGTCSYRDAEEKITTCVEDLEGEICLSGIDCTGTFVYAGDSGSRCCVEGVCDHPPSQPPDCEILGGTFCPVHMQCTGEEAFYHYTGYVCCVEGECVSEETPGPTLPDPSILDKLEGKSGVIILVVLEGLLLLIVIIAVVRRRLR